MQAEIAAEVAELIKTRDIRPGLAAVLVGDNAASQLYVNNKRKACEQVGVTSWLHQLPASTTQEQLLDLIGRLNADPAVHGILVQLPLPKQINESAIIKAVSPAKDVDGFGPESLGLLTAGCPRFLPCTPHGVQQLLVRNGIDPAGKHVVIVGRSNIVGKPLALILMQKARGADATVTVCHSRTPNIGALTRQADIIVMAIGSAHFLKADMVRPGAVVVDVGMNRLPDQKRPVGDVDFDAVKEVAAAITPVPGGVGPMTITMLLYNTLSAARQAAK
jgi:methylenetetrahydrofolate dehydrogenase (NADP+)/methenyltetrahydrofolate cyclohydrolase